MNQPSKRSLLAVAITAAMLTGCGDAETTLTELEPEVEAGSGHDHDHDHDHDHGNGDITVDSNGRLAVLSSAQDEIVIYDLDDRTELDHFDLTYTSNRLHASAGNRYAVVVSRDNDSVEFIDGGLWREDHDDHLHDYEQMPAVADFSLQGVRPTHVVSHNGQMAVFYDGDADTQLPAGVEVVTDNDIATDNTMLPALTFDVNKHGAAQPRGEYLISSVRRADAESTSNAKVLPDQVALYHLHDGEYELDETFSETCPDLHGSAQNQEYVAFGCADGVFFVHAHDGLFEAEKLMNAAEIGSHRIGTLFAHGAVEQFMGVATLRGSDVRYLVAIDPGHGHMDIVDWEAQQGAQPVSYAFSYDGEYFLVLDSLGYVSVLEQHLHDGEMHWELHQRVDFTDADVTQMPEGASFSMTVAGNGHYVWVADPITQHVVGIDLDNGEVEYEVELEFVPASVSWLGINAGNHQDGEHDHNH